MVRRREGSAEPKRGSDQSAFDSGGAAAPSEYSVSSLGWGL
jgi:hypothetical protein